MPDTQKTIAIKFTVESKDALANLNNIIKQAEQIKKQFADLTGVSQSSFAKIAEAMKKTKAQEIQREIKAVQEDQGAGIGLSKAEKAEKITALRKELQEYNKAMSFAVSELTRAANAEQQFSNSFNNRPLQEQLQIIQQINNELRNKVQATGINLTDKNQLRALENAQVKSYAQQRLAQVPLAQPGEKSTGAYEATAFKAASDDIREYRSLVKTELNKIVSEYRTSQRQIEADIKTSSKNKLAGEKQYFNAVIALKKEEVSAILEQAKKQREVERQGLTGGDLATKAKEQADAAVEAYNKANEAYKQQIEVRKTLAEQLTQTGDQQTLKELENAKKREEALKVESNMLKQNAATATSEYKKIADASSQTGKFTDSLTSLGKVASYVFGTIFGITAIGTLRNFMRYLGEAGQQAIQYTKILFTLDLAIRQMQRKGDTTTSIGVMKKEIADFRKEFNFFSEMEVTKAFAEATNKLANLGYTAEQVANVVRIGMIVYTTDLTGRFNDLGEAINGVTNYLASGYGESLERSGFISGRAGDKIAAYEMGLGQTLATLDPLTLSQTRYNLILGQASEKAADAAGYIETLSGQYQSASAAIVDANIQIGKSIDTIIVGWQKAKAAVLGYVAASLMKGNIKPEFFAQIDKLAVGYNKASKELDGFIKRRKNAEELGAAKNVLDYYDEQITKLQETKKAAEDLFMQFTYAGGMTEEGLNQLRNNLDRIFEEIEKRGAEPVLISGGIQMSQETRTRDVQVLQDYINRLTAGVTAIVTPKVDAQESTMDILKYKNTIQDILKEAESIQDDYTKRSTDIWNEYVNKVGTNTDEIVGDIRQLMNYDGTVVEVTVKGTIETDYAQKMAEIQADFEEKAGDAQGKIGEIAQDFTNKLAEAQRNYATQLAQSIRQYNINRAAAERKYRLNELQAERQFQEEMRKLREGYLMDLEGALRDRDALQVIRLAREYNLQVDQRKRQYEDEKQARWENYQEERKQAAIEQQEREKQLAEELSNRIAAITAERDAERAQAEEDRRKAEEEAKAERDRALADAKAQLEEQRTQLEIETKGKLDDFQKSLQDQGIITEQFLKDFGLELEKYFGKGKEYDKIMEFFRGSVAETGKELSVLADELSKTLGFILGAKSKISTTPVPGFSGLENPPVIGEPTTASDMQPIEIPVTVSTDDLKGQVDTAVSDVNKTVPPIVIPTVIAPPEPSTIPGGKAMPSLSEEAKSGSIQPEIETGIEPIEVPITVSADELKEQIDIAVTEVSKTIAPISIPMIITSPSSGGEVQSPEEIQPIELPIVVLNDEAKAQMEATLAEVNEMRIAGLGEIKAQNEAEQKELEAVAIERIKEFRNTLSEESIASADALRNLVEILRSYLGPGQVYDELLSWYESRTQAAAERTIAIWQMVADALKRIMNLGNQGQATLASIPKPKPKYSGGAEVYTKPTTLRVSEYEPEFVEIIPLSKLSRSKSQEIVDNPGSTQTAKLLAMSKLSSVKTNSKDIERQSSIKNITNSFGGSINNTYDNSGSKEINNKIQLLVGMEEGLYAKIVNMALDESAEIILDVIRNR